METTEMTVNTATPVMSQVSTSYGEGFSVSPEGGTENIHETPVEAKADALTTTAEEKGADQLLASAKDEGFEDALTHLAEGDFDPVEESSHEHEDNLEHFSKEPQFTLPETKADVEAEDLSHVDNMSAEEEERIGIISHMKELESQVINLDEKNKELAARLKDSEVVNTMAMQTLMEMTHALRELIDEEENEEEKISLLEIMVLVMGKMLETFYKPQQTEIGGSDEVVQQVESPRKKSKRNENVTRIMQYLQEKADRMPTSTQPEAPAQEVYAEAA